MISKKTRHVKLWLLMVIAVVFWTVGTGFYRDLSAKSEEAYEELKVSAATTGVDNSKTLKTCKTI